VTGTRKESEKAGAGNKPGSVIDNHSSGIAVTSYLKQPTRESVRNRRRAEAHTPLFGLAPGGVYRAASCYQSRGALLPHLFTLTDQGRRYIFCGTFHGLTPPRRYLAPCPKEPGLSSIANYSDCLANSGFLGSGVYRKYLTSELSILIMTTNLSN